MSGANSIILWQEGAIGRGATQLLVTLLIAGLCLFVLARKMGPWPGWDYFRPVPPAPEADRIVMLPHYAEPVPYQSMSAREFEEAIARLCVRDGCGDAAATGRTGDLGADVLATTPDGRRLVMQCKRYGTTSKVGSQDLQRFGGTCFTVHRADIALVVTTSVFTGPAIKYAAMQNIVLFDKHDLAAWTERTGPAPWQQMGNSPRH
ncbi:restriction endonuclease [Streptomyces sp. NPDC020951]|uniref:restriction endonuclease n=1 Tax=Streptomyces sp. NPDC020951 TaxID=3365104 RepID=UPI003794CF5F